MADNIVSRIPEYVELFYRNRPVIVTGGGGFLGVHVCALLQRLQAKTFIVKSEDFDLTDADAAGHAISAFDEMVSAKDLTTAPLLIHLAARVSGIHSTSSAPVAHLQDNVLMATNTIRAASEYGIRNVVAAGSVCAYPERAPVPMIEANLFNGRPEPTNFSYGMSKRYLYSLLDAYHQEGGLKNYIYLLQANLYGPHDHFDPRTSHVIPALIRKAYIAKDLGKPLEVWGSGMATRDFLYVWDAAIAYIVAGYKAFSREDEPLVCNIGSGEEISIAALAKVIADRVGVEEIVFDRTKPDGQKRRGLNVDLAKYDLGWEPKTKIQDGIKKTVDYFDTDILANV